MPASLAVSSTSVIVSCGPDSTFQQSGIFNQRQPTCLQTNCSSTIKINVWTGIIIGHGVAGPLFLPNWLTGEAYRELVLHDFLNNLSFDEDEECGFSKMVRQCITITQNEK